MLAPPSAWLSVLLSPEHRLEGKEKYLLEPCCSLLSVGVSLFLDSVLSLGAQLLFQRNPYTIKT